MGEYNVNSSEPMNAGTDNIADVAQDYGSTNNGSTSYGATNNGSTSYGATSYGATNNGSTSYGATNYGPTNYGPTNNGSTSYSSKFYQPTSYQGTTNVNGSIENNKATSQTVGVPAKVSVWTKLKKFLCQDITIDLTPKQEQAFKEIDDFWHQEVTWKEFKEFWLQDIEITL